MSLGLSWRFNRDDIGLKLSKNLENLFWFDFKF